MIITEKDVEELSSRIGICLNQIMAQQISINSTIAHYLLGGSTMDSFICKMPLWLKHAMDEFITLQIDDFKTNLAPHILEYNWLNFTTSFRTPAAPHSDLEILVRLPSINFKYFCMPGTFIRYPTEGTCAFLYTEYLKLRSLEHLLNAVTYDNARRLRELADKITS